MISHDISIIEWQPLPAPPERFLLVRWFEDRQIYSDVAFSNDGTVFTGPDDRPFFQRVGAWAYLPYDLPEPEM